MTNMNEILTRLQNGENPEDIANEMANMLNGALSEFQKAKDAEAARAKEAELKKEARLQELAEIFADTIVEYIAIAAPEVAEIVGDEVCDPAEVRKMLDAMIPGLAAAAQLAKTLSEIEEKKGPTSKITTASPEGADSIVNFLKANGLA